MSEVTPSGDPPPPPPAAPVPVRRRPFGVVGMMSLGAAVIVGVWTAYWLAMSNSVRDGIDSWITDQAARGVQVTYQSLEVQGYPFWLDVRMSGARVYVESGVTVEWRPAFIQARARPWQISTVEVDLAGAHELVGARRVSMTARRLGATLTIGKGGAVSGFVVRKGLNGDISRAGDFALGDVNVDFHWRGPADGTQAVPLRIDFGADGAVLPAAWASPLGRGVETVRLIARIAGQLSHLRDPDLLTNWRDDGGTLEVSRFNLHHGPLRVGGDGTLALDRALQPVGAFAVRAEGFMETVDALRDRHLIGPGEAVAMKLVLTVLATRPAGQPPRLEAPLTLQDRRVSLKTLTLMKLPRIDWTRVLGVPSP